MRRPTRQHLQPAGRYIMSYVAFGPRGPRAALAASTGFQNWDRLGIVKFGRQDGIDCADCDNKDVRLFPRLIADAFERQCTTVLHRLHFKGSSGKHPAGIWLSYAPAEDSDPGAIGCFSGHRLLAGPVHPWECLKIGCGTPPILTRFGWLIIYHGVGGSDEHGCRIYSAGLMLLDADEPTTILYRTADPIFRPELEEEMSAFVLKW